MKRDPAGREVMSVTLFAANDQVVGLGAYKTQKIQAHESNSGINSLLGANPLDRDEHGHLLRDQFANL
jgi:hypothetical protein